MKALLILLLVSCFSNSYTQELKIGDVLPDWTFYPLVNGSKPEKLSDHQDKAIIIDFWHSSCGACYKMLPHLYELEKEFSKDIKAFVIADDLKDDLVKQAFDKRPSLKSLGVTIYKRDAAFFELFPHDEVPHIILVDKERRIRSITQGQNLSRNALAQLIRGEDPALPVKTITAKKDPSSPFILNGIIDSTNLLFNSVLTKRNSELPHGMGFRSQGNKFKIYYANGTAKSMYAIAYGSELHLHASDFHTRMLIKDEQGLLSLDSLYCYELIIPASSDTRRDRRRGLEYMRADLDRYFQRTSGIIKKESECYVLGATEQNLPVKSGSNYTQEWKDFIEFNQVSLPVIAIELRAVLPDLPLIVETDFGCKYSFILKRRYNSLEELKYYLAKQGLLLKKEKRQLEYLSIH